MTGKLQWVESLITKFGGQHILVVGDLMLDRYIYGTVSRISPEAPVPVVRVMDEKNMPGGAANVARNIQALGGCAQLCGVVGQDPLGQELLAVLARDGITTTGVMQLPGMRTTVKTRIIAERQQVVRVDWEDQVKLPVESLRVLCRESAAAVRRSTGVIIADYAKGAIRQELVAAILSAAKRHRIPVALDPNQNTVLKVQGITVATPNRKEAFSLARVPEQTPKDNPLKDEALARVAGILMKQWGPSFLVITLGAQGMLLASRSGGRVHIPTVAREVFDVSGAGDTVIAALLLAVAAGASEKEAAELATCAAGVVVGKIGTAVCAGRELMAFYQVLVKTGMNVVRRS
ncbi:MAG: carbohydrate kinase [Verrucomicrobia bacterium]|nr:carbohydrate kinase [Verrucomicrobiota bacterium]MBU4289653.1 carbohydrate kinase [Verrucomicrobiota bacterium]MBU4430093.1 carbohydrate kinase [Verrucomicrobiota bacterium]MCG2681351.1 PfkB family carbohydrate kinase [Kiritimatiellia bacterium]